MRDEAGHEDKVERTITYDLVGDIHVAALRVTNLGG